MSLKTGLRFAQRHLLAGDAGLDAESWLSTELPEDERQRLLLELQGPAGQSSEDLIDHLGDPPIPADRLTHNVVASFLRHSFPSCHVVGEEATNDEWTAAEAAGDGSLIFSLDAIDGSLPYECLTFGYSSNLLAFRRIGNRHDLLLVAIANSSGYLAVYEAPGRLHVGDFDNLKEISELDPLAMRPRHETVAIVAAKAKDRRRAAFLYEEPDLAELTIWTTGGAPAALGLIIGNLGAIVCTSDQTTHDAAYLPMLAFLGIPIIACESGVVLSFPDVLGFFQRIAVVPDDRLAHPVPRFVAARDMELAARLAKSVHNNQTRF
ncbi:MAG: hypothetical protein ACJ72I_03230 [Pseudonocardiaceae bacterium]